MKAISLRHYRSWAAIICGLSAFVIAPEAFSGGDYRFQKENLALIVDVKTILVKNGFCQDLYRCSSKQIILSESTPWGLDVEIYGITDPAIIRQIDSACAEYFYRSDAISVRSRFFAETKAEEVQAFLFSKPKPIVIVNREHSNVKR